MNELSIVLQKEQEVKEKIETAQRNADLILQDKKNQLAEKLARVCLDSAQEAQIRSAKEKKIEIIRQSFQEKTQKALDKLEDIKKSNTSKAVEYLVEKTLCSK
ncbi:MAG: hypothetical protein PHY72_02830 [Candidatus Pacebacteria bacterium]|nr:hypothetical protein [Candidatus Paceibacterota bacterium]